MDFIALSQTDWSGSNSVRKPPQLFIPPAKLNERCIKHAHIFSPGGVEGIFIVFEGSVCDINVLGVRPTTAAADNCLIKFRLFVISVELCWGYYLSIRYDVNFG
jgi:hypothetical protein